MDTWASSVSVLYTYAYICIHTHTHMHAHTPERAEEKQEGVAEDCAYTHTTHAYARLNMLEKGWREEQTTAHTHTHIHTHTHTCTYTYTHIHT